MLVLVLAGIVLIFFTRAQRVLCSGYVTKTAQITHPGFAIAEQSLHSLKAACFSDWVPSEWAGGAESLAGDTAGTADPNVTTGISQTI